MSVRVTACRPCGHALIRSYAGKTLWQGWWGAISFFFNWFVLAANLNAWRQLRAIENPSLSGTFVAEPPRVGVFEDSPQENSEAKPKRRFGLRTGGGVVVLGFMALGLIGWGWDATHHDHTEAHGVPATAAMVERAMAGPSTMDDGSTIVVAKAICTGEGEATPGGHTHFMCQLVLDDGNGDEVVVHLLAGDQLFFKSAVESHP